MFCCAICCVGDLRVSINIVMLQFVGDNLHLLLNVFCMLLLQVIFFNVLGR